MRAFETLKEEILNKKTYVSVIGLGYVGLPLAIAFSKIGNVVGFDIDKNKIDNLKLGIDMTNEVDKDTIIRSNIEFTSDERDIMKSRFHIIAVPTPIDENNIPDLRYLVDASTIVGRNLKKGSIVVYESTVYPGTTEEVCIPILEKESNMKCGVDFKVGYSPERINPGDKVHTIETIVKVVSAIDNESLETIASIYSLVLDTETYKVDSIRIAEAAKILENAQRDINIAFINEFAIMMDLLNIDTHQVIEAASTKWNFIKFVPGLVGGHCIGVDPYYLAYLSEKNGYIPQVLISGRQLNEYMSKYIAENTVKNLIKSGARVKGSKVGILGFTFKENCPDIRNTKVADIVNKLKEYEVEVIVYDPIVNKEQVKEQYGIEICQLDDLTNVNALIIAVAHEEFFKYKLSDLKKIYSSDNVPVLIDVKRIFKKTLLEEEGFIYWGL